MLISSPLYVICDADACRRAGWTLIDFASACLDGGARLLQVRSKAEPSGRFLDETLAIVERAAGAAQVIVNDRADVARLAGAAGVHVGQEDLSPVEVRSILGEQAIVGWSTHTTRQLDAALSRADFLRRDWSGVHDRNEVDRLRCARPVTGARCCDASHPVRIAPCRDRRHHARPRRGRAAAGRRRRRGDWRHPCDQRSGSARARLFEPSFKVIIRAKRLI